MIKKSTFFLIVCGALAGSLIIVILIHTAIKNKQIETAELHLQEIESSYPEVYYAEGDEDEDYNYITNTHIINDNIERIPYAFYQELGANTDNYLKANGNRKRSVTIINVKDMQPYAYITFQIDGTDETFELCYEYGKNIWAFR